MINEYKEIQRVNHPGKENFDYMQNRPHPRDIQRHQNHGVKQEGMQYPSFVKYEGEVKHEDRGNTGNLFAEINAPNLQQRLQPQYKNEFYQHGEKVGNPLNLSKSFQGGINRLYESKTVSNFEMDSKQLIKEEETPQQLLDRLNISTNLVTRDNQGLTAVKHEDLGPEGHRQGYRPY